MPSAGAAALPGLLFVPARFAAYKAASRRIREVLERYTALSSRSRWTKPISM